MKSILNLTLETATIAQIDAGVVDLPEDTRESLRVLMDSDADTRVSAIADIALKHSCQGDRVMLPDDPDSTTVRHLARRLWWVGRVPVRAKQSGTSRQDFVALR